MKKPAVLLVFVALASVVGCGGGGSSQVGSTDAIYTNGGIYTADEDQPWAEAVAVKGNTIAFVGVSCQRRPDSFKL